ncbi:hypothetical protein CA13_58500 [Planctomycetes bacterium CA13]|uniref:Uncharacterized protein n=1 Tax=Novipirellula herctigrandis TaxID=2527986 RepID=A0A5C5ZAL4_9BACT|nr:hypothetical protein CA13_58500 [Planctomycetes bacterium CA13]
MVLIFEFCHLDVGVDSVSLSIYHPMIDKVPKEMSGTLFHAFKGGLLIRPDSPRGTPIPTRLSERNIVLMDVGSPQLRSCGFVRAHRKQRFG